MCIRIWGDLLRRLISLPGERPTPRRASRPRASVGSRQDRYSADDEADAYAAEGAAATHLDDRDTPPQRPVPPFAPEHLHVRFTQRAWVSLLSETLYKVATETGGILLGYRDGDDRRGFGGRKGSGDNRRGDGGGKRPFKKPKYRGNYGDYED